MMFKSMSWLALVLVLALVAFGRTSSARIQAEQPAAPQDHDHAQSQDQAEPQAEALPPMPPVNLTGKWTFDMYGSKWTVELKPEPTKNPNETPIYCGMAARERRDADTPVITRRLCANVDEYVLYAS